MTFWIVLTIALFLTVIGLIAICLKKEKQNKNLLEQKPKWDTEIDRQKAELKNLQQSVEQFRNLAASERNDYDEAKKSRQNIIAENDKLFKAQQTQNAATLLEQTSQLKQLLAEIAAISLFVNCPNPIYAADFNFCAQIVCHCLPSTHPNFFPFDFGNFLNEFRVIIFHFIE